MFTSDDLLWGIALPLGVSLLLTAALGGWRWGVTLALAAAYIAGHIAIRGLPGAAAASAGDQAPTILESIKALAPHDATDWALVAALAAGLVGVCVSCSCVTPGAVGLGRILLAFGVVNAVLWPLVEGGQWTTVQALVYVQSVIGILLVISWSLDGLAERITGPTVPLILALTTLAAAALALFEGSQSLAQLIAILAAALLGAFLVALFRRTMDISRGGVAVTLSVAAALLITTTFYATPPKWAALTIALAPLAAGLLLAPPLRSMRPLAATVLAAILVLIPLAAAVVPSALDFARETESQPEQSRSP